MKMLNARARKNKLQEEKLFESELKFSKLFENGPFGMVITDKEYRFKKANPAFCSVLGYTETELLKLTFKDLSHPDDLKNDLPNILKLINKEISVYKTEKRYIRKDGQVMWGSLSVTTAYDREGQFLYNLGIIEDITRRKDAEERLTQLNERITTATRASQVGIWDWNVKNNVLDWDDQMYALHGLKEEAFTSVYEALMNGLHPDDIDFCQNEARLALLGEKVYDTEFRVIWPDGTIHYIKAKGEVFRDEKGVPVRMVGINYDITEQKKTDKKIREKDLQFRKLSANVHDLIFQFTRKPDGSYFVPIASEGIRNIFGCSPEDVLNDFSPIASVIHPEDAERVLKDIEYSAKHLSYFTCEFRVQIPGKPVQWIFSRSTPEKLPDGSITWYGFNADITYRRQIEESLRESESKLRKIYEDGPFGIALTNNNFKFLMANPKFCQITGYQENELLNSTFSDITHPEDSNIDIKNIRKLINGEIQVYKTDKRYIRKDGQFIWGSLTITSNFSLEGDFIYNIVILEDITARKQAEKEVKRLNMDLENRIIERTSQIQAVNQELEAFSYSVSHDLRAPLRHINGFAEILARQFSANLPEGGLKYLSTIISSAQKMGTLIDDLLSFSRTGRTELRKSSIKMDQVVSDGLAQIKESIQDRKIIWDISPLPEVYGDYNLLKLVWINLMDNAAKYSSKRETAEIRIGYKDEKNEFVFFIRDNGVGFDMKYAQKLFGVFQRLHSATLFDGTGIGLANVRRIITRHGGNTWAESEIDKGAIFYFSIPK